MRRTPLDLLYGKKAMQHHYYEAHKSMGKCARCSNPPAPGKVCCQECIDKMAAGKRQAREQGMCLDCWTEPVQPGKRFCATHQARREERDYQRSMVRFVRGLCQECGKKRVYGHSTLCKEHLVRR